jgi:hypothetical protein
LSVVLLFKAPFHQYRLRQIEGCGGLEQDSVLKYANYTAGGIL